MSESNNFDLIDKLRREWEYEDPMLDTSAMDVVGRVIKLASQWTVETNAAMKPFGLKYTEFDIIATLRRSGKPYELTPTQLCESILLTSGAMTTALNRVEQLGLIERALSVSDKRVKTARLTQVGISLARKAAERRFGLAKHHVQNLSKKEINTLTSLLKICGP
ncbi:MAG: MarR family transcriptional regulator [Hellea sp.]